MLDGWAHKHIGERFDEDGQWSRKGVSDSILLARLMAEPFLDAPPPKSTGRELFRLRWLEDRLPRNVAPADVEATLADFTAQAIVQAIDRFCAGVEEIFLAGGGARNPALVERIARLAGRRPVAPTDELGVPTGHVESMAFAWLAMKCVRREPVDLTAVTGASAPRILGAVYAA